MSKSIALASLVAADLYLLWILFQGDGDIGASRFVGRDILVLAIAGCTFLGIVTGVALVRRSSRRTETLLVRNGAIQRGDAALAALAGGRPLTVVVQEGQVAVVEKRGRYARILGPGRGQLSPGETIHKVILTNSRSLVGTVDCSTRDSVPVTAEFELEARILPARGEAPLRRPSAPTGSPASAARAPTCGFAWSQDAVVRAAYASPNWELAVLNAARHSLREQLASAALGEIFDLEERHREALPFSVIADHVRIELNDQCRAWGAEVLRFQLNRVKMPAPTEQSILSKWKARHQVPSDLEMPHEEPAGSEVTSSYQQVDSRGATLRLVPVLSRGPATSLREAVRQRLGYLTADAVEIAGERYLIRPAVDSATTELTLRPDATYFALAVHGDNLARNGVTEGDYVLFESQSEAASGSLAATLIGGELAIKRLTRKPGHSLLEPDCTGQPAVVLTDSDARRDELFVEYATSLPPVEYWPADDARILGSAVMTFKTLSPKPRPPVIIQTRDEGELCPQDSPMLDGALWPADGDSAGSVMPDEPPAAPSDSTQLRGEAPYSSSSARQGGSND
jgi:hypothetical protein